MVRHTGTTEEEERENNLPDAAEMAIVAGRHRTVRAPAPEEYDVPGDDDGIEYESGDRVPDGKMADWYSAFDDMIILLDGEGNVVRSPRDMDGANVAAMVQKWENGGFDPHEYIPGADPAADDTGEDGEDGGE